jgi:hypothetical protein
MTTDYGAGVAHAPAYNDPKSRTGMGSGNFSQWGFDRVRWECENGLETGSGEGDGGIFWGVLPRKPILPTIEDVLYCLASEADALDHPTFESWASDLGYDPDSRSAETTYRACLETARKLRAALGDDGLARLREAFQDF